MDPLPPEIPGILLAVTGGMTSTQTGRQIDELLAHAEAMLKAGPQFWPAFGLTPQRAERLGSNIKRLREADCAFCSALTARLTAVVSRQALDREVWDFITASREVLKGPLGRQWSEKWAPVGFVGGSLQIPEKIEDRVGILRRLVAYFRCHPEQLSQRPALADGGERLLGAMNAALAEVAGCKEDLRAAARDMQEARQTLRSLMLELVGGLHTRLRRSDVRWQGHYGNQLMLLPAPNTAISGKAQVESPAVSGRVSRGRRGILDRATELRPLARQMQFWNPQGNSEVGNSRRESASSRRDREAEPAGNSVAPAVDSSPVAQVELKNIPLSSALAWLLPPA